MTLPAVVVTGAAAGIGRATVELFAERGYGVVAVDPDTAGLAELDTIKNVVTLEGDVSTEETNVEAVRLAVKHFDRLDAA
ncbi:SDR family oxidoreductase, partial [Candidatus Protofrankia californiensis]|uniref:SDR family oxidoreductase n=1 Tax=Candidatus Protofrankia californiensis TaxID=1839754 RepID=UPI001F49A4BE